MSTVQSLAGDSANVGKGSDKSSYALLTSSGNVNPVTSLSAATTGNGATVDFGTAQQAISFSIVATGTVTAGQVTMQVSPDGVNWFTPPAPSATNLNFNNNSAATLANPYVLVTNTAALFTVTAAVARYARAIVSTNVTGGATVTVTISAV